MRTREVLMLAMLLVASACGGELTLPDRAGAGSGGSGDTDGGTASEVDGGVPPPSTSDAGADAGDDAQIPEGCGDGFLQPGELCDDANAEAGDGCSPDCATIETDFVCPAPGMACVFTVKCGDGRVSGDETCDDGHGIDGDGCDAACQVEAGWSCPRAGAPCEAAACGDGILVGNEQCEDDDATPADGDGCSAACKLEAGFACDSVGEACRATVCNDGVKEGSEPCDDGNQIIGDGCNPFCEVEPRCSSSGCTSRCGDGLILPTDAEDCDDGNTRDGDGCSANCLVEDGYACVLVTDALPDTLEVPVTYRDLIALPNGSTRHPDFQAYDGDDPTPGLVLPDLGSDGKPVYAGICDAAGTAGCPFGQQLTTQADFDQWYNDAPGVNLSMVTRMGLMRQPDGSYFIANSSFFPFSGLGWDAMGSEDTATDGNGVVERNFGFTSEIRTWFEFAGGEQLDFSGDDDVWVFINGKLAVDIGGLHPERQGAVTLDAATATMLGLNAGNIYEMALFHAERHTDYSNFNLTLSGFVTAKSACQTDCGDGVVAGDEQCDDGDNDGSYGSCTADCQRGPFCGDGVVDTPQEQCDDGINLTPYDTTGDGACGPGCKRAKHCGDGEVNSLFGERCDDGDNDGGYNECGKGCTLGPRCGDRVVQDDEGEECDDGNLVNHDGCSAECRLEGPE